jgi:hypothetical protein
MISNRTPSMMNPGDQSPKWLTTNSVIEDGGSSDNPYANKAKPTLIRINASASIKSSFLNARAPDWYIK